MLRRVLFAVVLSFAAMALMTAALAWAVNMNYSVHLTGDAERPDPVETQAQGQFILKINDDGTAEYKLIVSNIFDVRAAHLHLAGIEDAGPVVVNLFLGPTKEGRFQSVLAEGTFTSADLVGPLAGTAMDDFIVRIEASEIYVNVHTDANPPGEIRAQVM